MVAIEKKKQQQQQHQQLRYARSVRQWSHFSDHVLLSKGVILS